MGFLDKLFGKKEPQSTQGTKTNTQPFSSHSVDEEYVKYIMNNNPSVKREEVVAFLSVLDVFDKTNSKQKALEAYDSFITNLATANPMRAMMVNGFFCGLLGGNISLSDTEITSLSQKYTPMIISKLNSQSK